MIRPFGEAALLVETGSAQRAQELAGVLREDSIDGVTAGVPGLESLLVELDPLVAQADAEAVRGELERRLGLPAAVLGPGRVRSIPVVYGSEMGPDLPEVAALTGMSEAEVAERHAAADLRVLFDGFAPGFAYLGELPAELRVPRLAKPRTRTPAGSVAIAGAMSGVYPAALPGGWRVIGRTPAVLFDPLRDPPTYLVPGDRVWFDPIDRARWEERAGPPEDW